jgi:cytochrome c nitrite reductase small subunit
MKIVLIIGIIAALAVLGTLLYVSDFTAYLGNNPSTCNNCHVMDNVYEGWYHGAHKNWTTCNECHTPHALIPKYITKARSGYHHVTAFVFGDIPNAIRAKEESRAIVQENCVRCHETTVEDIGLSEMMDNTGKERYCFECHRDVAHGQRGLSILPYQHSEESK